MENISNIISSFEHAACGLMTTETNGKIHGVNNTFCTWLGYTSTELLDKKNLHELFTIDDQLFYQTHLLPILELQGSVSEVQIDMIRLDGKVLPMLINVARKKEGTISVDHLAFFVVTDRKNYELELNKQRALNDRRKDEFLATLAHELRNPLAPMRNILEIMHLKENADPFLCWSRDVIERHVTQITHLVDDLMEASRISQGRLELRKQLIDIADVMQHAIETATALIAKSSHVLSIKWPEIPLIVDADSTRMIQVISNLLTNAAKYTPSGGDIYLSATREENDVVISVRDSGIGIPQHELLNIFKMFSQLTPALQRSQGGLGIGLALARGLVELHGGIILAKSNGEGKGSEFIVRLPIAEPKIDLTPAIKKSPALMSPHRILVIDDNIDATNSLVMLLEIMGHDLRSAINGLDGIALAEAFRPNLILLDIGLPDINGYEVAQRIRNTSWGKEIFLAAATGWAQIEDKEKAKAAGFNSHLTKPIHIQELENILSKLTKSEPS